MTACPPPPKVRSVRVLGAAPRAEDPSWMLVGQDGGQSIDLGDDILFVFADTLLALIPEAERHRKVPALGQHGVSKEQGWFLGNSAALAEGTDLRQALATLRYFDDSEGRPREILEPSDIERALGARLWPEHGLFLGDEVHLFYLAIQQLEPETWGFASVGTGMARLDPRTGRCRRLQKEGGDWQFWPSIDNGFHVGVQVLRQGETAYVFASHRQGLGCAARLLRAPIDRLDDPSAYEYLNSYEPTWASEFADSLDLGPAAPEFSVSWNAYLDRYLMVFVDGYSKELCLRVAPQIWGPYSDVLRAGVLPHHPESAFIALGFEHPTFAKDDGRTVYISYSQPHFAQNSLVALTFA